MLSASSSYHQQTCAIQSQYQQTTRGMLRYGGCLDWSSIICLFLQRCIYVEHLSHERNVCPSVCLSSKRVNCDKTYRNFGADFYTIRKKQFSSFPTQRMVGGDNTFYLKFWSKLTPSLKKTATSNRYLLAIRRPYSERKSISNRKSYALSNALKMNIVRSP